MVLIALPPPDASPDPIIFTVAVGSRLIRLLDPTRHWKPGPLTFNFNGPRSRFDHHRPAAPGSSSPYADDPDRGVYYAAFTLSCCLAEVFGDYRLIDRPRLNIAYPKVTRSLNLLDLCGNGAMRAGSVAALCGTADRQMSQVWARYFYEDPVFRACDGLRYHSAHNNESVVLLFERARNALRCPRSHVIAINDPLLRSE